MNAAVLIKYDEAKRAIAAAANVDEVKDIADKAAALQAYARQAKDTELEKQAAKIRLRAKRRIGELSKSLEKAPSGKAAHSRSIDGTSKTEALKAAGLSKAEAHRCEQVATVPEEEFEAYLTKCDQASRVASSDELVKRVTKKVQRAEKIEKIAEKNAALPVGSKYNVIYADPPWQYRNVVSEDRRLENHYPTMPLADICAMPVRDIAADDSILFLWATITELPGALEVMRAWGFEYRSHAVWVKPSIGIGFWFRAQHELLLVGVRGSIPTPIESARRSSVIEAPTGAHSEKPECVAELIDGCYGQLSRIELFARKAREGWHVWGNQSDAA
jgi:N6-adenosine-specific RNA methylase IME4